MYSIAETTESEIIFITATPSIRIVFGILYWPPKGSSISRKNLEPPGPDWVAHNCNVLKDNIETFKEALELEKRYSKHRNSLSFREYQERLRNKREHPVNYNQTNLDLIDVTDMVKKIKDKTGTNDFDAEVSAPPNKYHENCVGNTKTKMKSTIKATSPVASKKDTKKKTAKKPLPFQTNYLKPGISKAKNRVGHNSIEPKRPRYDNFLKSGTRFNAAPCSGKAKTIVPCATITKDQYLKQIRRSGDSNDENGVSASKIRMRASTPVETQVNNRREDPMNHSKENSNISRNIAERAESSFIYNIDNDFSIPNESDNEIVQDSIEANNNLQGIPSRPKTISSEGSMSFEERILKELSDLKKAQESFESRIEKRIENLINDQPRMNGNGQSRTQSNGQSRTQGDGQFRIQGMQGNYQSQKKYQSRQYGAVRNEMNRALAYPEQYDVDFDDFEEMDEHFPVDRVSEVEELEFCIRRDLDFKFRLLCRLNELGGSKYKKCIRLKMKYLFTDPVLEHYTWRGTAEKDPFKNLKSLNNLILRSVRSRCPNTQGDEYKEYMMQWLKHAKTRQRKVTYSYPARMESNRDGSFDVDE